jgi:TRAP-type C4-dicarboxylate transport system substrate-binding protein
MSRLRWSVVACMVVSLALVGRAHAAPPITLKLASAAPAGTPGEALLKEYKKNVEARAGGRLKVKLLLGAAADDGRENVRRCKDGQVQAAAASLGAASQVAPELAVVELPFLFRTFDEADEVVDAVLGPGLDPILKDAGLVLGFWSENGFRHFALKAGFVKSPADLAGKKMRAQENQVHLEMYRNLGASPVPVPNTEVLPALKDGTVEGFDQTLVGMLAKGWQAAIKFVTLTGHIYQPSIVVFNKAWFEGLPADLQAILLEEGKAVQTRGRAQARVAVKKQVKQLTDAGIQVYEPSDAERAGFEKATAPGRQSFRKTVGKRGAKLLDEAEAAIAKSRAR